MTIMESVAIKDVLEVLNRAVEKDKKAMGALCKSKVECNKELANDETIQCGMHLEHRYNTVGIVGILNGLFGTDERGWGVIGAQYEVVCPSGEDEHNKQVKHEAIGDPCPVCGLKLVLGDLIRFVDMREEYKKCEEYRRWREEMEGLE